MSGELEEQADELLALSTILDDRAFNHTGTDPHKGSLAVQVKTNYFLLHNISISDSGEARLSSYSVCLLNTRELCSPTSATTQDGVQPSPGLPLQLRPHI